MLTLILLSACDKKEETGGIGQTVNNTFSTIKEAVVKELPVKCEYNDEDGEKIEIYIKGMKVRFRGTGDQANLDGLMMDGKYYLWDKVKREGMELNLDKFLADGSTSIGGKEVKSVDDVIGVLEEKKENCVITSDNDLFVKPSDVKFSDGSGFLQ